MPELPTNEAREEDEREHGEADRATREPALLSRLRDRVDERGKARGDEHRSREVERLHLCVAALVEQNRRENHRENSDRDVDEEDPFPAERVGEDPTHEDTRGGAEATDGAPDAERDVSLATFMERRRENRERGRGDDRRAEPLERARRYE